MTTGNMAKSYHIGCEEEIQKYYGGNRNRFLTAKTNLVISRLRKMAEYGILTIHKTTKNNKFKLNDKKVRIRYMKNPDGNRGRFIWVKDKEGKWLALEY